MNIDFPTLLEKYEAIVPPYSKHSAEFEQEYLLKVSEEQLRKWLEEASDEHRREICLYFLGLLFYLKQQYSKLRQFISSCLDSDDYEDQTANAITLWLLINMSSDADDPPCDPDPGMLELAFLKAKYKRKFPSYAFYFEQLHKASFETLK